MFKLTTFRNDTLLKMLRNTQANCTANLWVVINFCEGVLYGWFQIVYCLGSDSGGKKLLKPVSTGISTLTNQRTPMGSDLCATLYIQFRKRSPSAEVVSEHL
jgi:hypothetical protein